MQTFEIKNRGLQEIKKRYVSAPQVTWDFVLRVYKDHPCHHDSLHSSPQGKRWTRVSHYADQALPPQINQSYYNISHWLKVCFSSISDTYQADVLKVSISKLAFQSILKVSIICFKSRFIYLLQKVSSIREFGYSGSSHQQPRGLTIV